MYKLDLEKAEEPEIILPISAGSQRKKEFQKTKQTNKQKKTKNFCFIDYTKVFECVDHKKLENS